MDSVLFGALTVQLFLYYQAFPNDVLSNKSLAYTIYILNFGMTMLFFDLAIATFGFGFSNISALTPISLTSCVGSVLMDTSSPTEASQAHFLAVGVWCGGSALCDILIAVCMTYYLTKINTELRHIGAWLSKLTRLTIETNSLTGIDFVFIICSGSGRCNSLARVSPRYLLPLRGYYPAKFYGYSVLVVLNSRIEIVGSRGTHHATTSQIIAAVSLPPLPRDTRATIDRENPSGVTITREVSSNAESDNWKVMGVDDRVHGADAEPEVLGAAHRGGGHLVRAVYDALIRLSTVEKRSKIPEVAMWLDDARHTSEGSERDHERGGAVHCKRGVTEHAGAEDAVRGLYGRQTARDTLYSSTPDLRAVTEAKANQVSDA
ncbi:hypothetical protein B0H14DRAFT_3129019 [Mycena olivaceomarginata]|nr:hypothetical protein B0H14DRAFT_3129019 [Mycena olivaceomarginata]